MNCLCVSVHTHVSEVDCSDIETSPVSNKEISQWQETVITFLVPEHAANYSTPKEFSACCGFISMYCQGGKESGNMKEETEWKEGRRDRKVPLECYMLSVYLFWI